MKARLIPAGDPAWAMFLDDVRHDFYHLPAWASLEAARMGGEAVALHVVDRDRALLLPLIIRPISGSTVDAASPYGYPGPLSRGTDDPAFVGEALTAALPEFRSRGIVSLFIRFHPLLNPLPPRHPGTLVLHGDTVAIDLTLTEDALWQQMRRNHRDDISRSLEQGHRCWYDDDWLHFEDFKRLYRATMRRVEASDEYFFDDAYFDGMRSALGDRLRLCIVEIDQTVAAAIMFVETCGIVEYHLVGVDEGFLRHAPAKLALHTTCVWAKRRGDSILHLGGGVGAASDSLLRFKTRFSPLRFSFCTLRTVIDEVEYARLAHQRDPTGDSLGRAGFFPAYRRGPSDSDTKGTLV